MFSLVIGCLILLALMTLAILFKLREDHPVVVWFFRVGILTAFGFYLYGGAECLIIVMRIHCATPTEYYP
jgi:hypothetical protein